MLSSGPTKPRLLGGDEVDEPLETGVRGRLRRGCPSGGSARRGGDGLLAYASWRGMRERRCRLADYRLREAAGSCGWADRC